MRIETAVGLILACAVAWPAAAQEKNAQPGARAIAPAISVTAVRNPVDKSYRKMLRGMELFEEMRATAPNATLRYKLLPRKPDSKLDGIQLSVDGNSFSTLVDLAPDRTFTLVRDAKALAEDASVRTDRRALTMTWRAEIRTPGLPPDTRRLGDLRLECHVGMEADLVSNIREVRSLFFGRVTNARMREQGYCDQNNARYLYFAERPLFGVTLVSGARRQALSVDDLYAGLSRSEFRREDLPYCDCEVLLDRAYFLPLGDRSWPDDTLVEFEYMDGQATAAAPGVGKPIPIGASRNEVLAALGKGTEISFDSGYGEWIYRYTEPARAQGVPPKRSEYVVLFAPSGVVAKTRLRTSS